MVPSIHHFSSTFFTLFILLLLHLGCFTFSSHHNHNHRHRHNRRDSLRKKLAATKTTIFSFISGLSASSKSPRQPPPPSIPSPSSSTRSLRLTNPPIITPITANTLQDNYPLLFRKDIHPCTVCGEVFQTLTLLEHHQSTKHAVSELLDGENIIRIIFKAGWPDKAKTPTIQRILKIHNTHKILNRFEEYRESVKSIAEDQIKTLSDERCAADGNEVLRFYCTTFICELDSSICSQRYCSLCGIIRCGFSCKMDGICMLTTSYRAHAAIPEDMEEEFGFMHVKRALLVCRVIAGRVGCGPDLVGHGFDSLVGGEEEDELLVFNPRAVLPCFVIAYTV